jgi:hypothetical protein
MNKRQGELFKPGRKRSAVQERKRAERAAQQRFQRSYVRLLTKPEKPKQRGS